MRTKIEMSLKAASAFLSDFEEDYANTIATNPDSPMLPVLAAYIEAVRARDEPLFELSSEILGMWGHINEKFDSDAAKRLLSEFGQVRSSVPRLTALHDTLSHYIVAQPGQ